MVNLPRGRASDLILNTPGFREIHRASVQGLEPLFMFQTASVTISTGASTAIVPALVPFDAEWVALIVNLTTTSVGTETITLGLSGDTDAYGAGMVIAATTAPATLYFARSDATSPADIPAGTAVLVTNDGGSTAGAARFTLVVKPKINAA